MQIINSVVKGYFRTRLPQIDSMMREPVAHQHRVHQQLLKDASETEFGKRFGYATIADYATFKQSVPIQDYDSLRPYFERMQQGEADLLWRGQVMWYAKSSGTTNDASKFIPVSREGVISSHILTGKDFIALYLRNNPKSKFFSGKGIAMGGACHPLHPHSPVMAGDVSAILMKHFDSWIQYFRTPDIETALMVDWTEKLEKIATLSTTQPVTNISGVPTWTLLLMKRILQRTGAKTIGEVWPLLELYAHGGVGFSPYREQFDALIGKPIHYQNVYNASEGFFAFQDSLEQRDDMLLHTDNGVFYEFIPFNGSLKTDEAVSIEGLKIGVNYALVVSTNSGLWRYLLGDTITCTSLHPVRIRITGRTKHYINVFGEEVSIDNTDRALAECCRALTAIATEYTVAPCYLTTATQGRHEWAIEFERTPEDIAVFEQLLDERLRALNSDYDAKRSGDLALSNLKVHILKPGTYYRWLESRGKLGSQQKVPRLQNDRKLLAEVLENQK